ncbi:unnamed protein product [Clonostachys rosea]|uniref:Major facilitator superfamily (MFS) profile domain-containing protein n=1 Tax=Bionectria ochroleuca TaxID=29856 RepID=A0ABY6UEN2_BIOOC|nr:unnamed protein product [Clonostachys rosea]
MADKKPEPLSVAKSTGIAGDKCDVEVGTVTELDQTEIFLRENGVTHSKIQELSQDESRVKALVRRVDLVLLPLLCITFILQFIDKQVLSYGAVFDLFTDTNITSEEYSWLGSLFYFGFLFAEYPASYLGQIFPIGRVCSIFVILWGITTMATAACYNFQSLAALRFLLGCFEAPISPCFFMIIGMWYIRQDQPFRAGIFYSCNGLGVMIGGIMNYGVGQLKSFQIWKALYLICGGATLLWGFILLWLLPQSITDCKRFTVEERAILIGRVAANQTGILNKKFRLYQVREALLDGQVWLLFFFTLFNETINGGYATFGKLIVKGVVNGDTLKTVLYAFPSGGFLTFFILSGTFLSTKLKNGRTIVMILYLFPTIIGTTLVWQLPRSNKYGLLLSYYIINSFVASLVLSIQMAGGNVAGYTKRLTSTCFIFLAYCAGNIIGPHAFIGAESPTYPTGCKTIISCAAGQIVCVVLLRVLLVRRNKMRDEAHGPAEATMNTEDAIIDLTDFENRNFRYLL